MYKNMLPLGSVVLLKGGKKRVMVCGRVLTRADDDKIYDYCACYFPEGVIGAKNMVFFDRDAIEQIFFLGYTDIEEQKFSQEFLGNLGELTLENGKIVKKES